MSWQGTRMFGGTQSSSRMKMRWTALGAALLLLAIVMTGLYLGSHTRKQFLDIADGWSEFSSEADQKGALISAIRGHMGYGGIIHTFKNYVLRQDELYRQRLLNQLAQFDVATADYLSLPISIEEQAALTAIIETVDAYRTQIPNAEQAAASAWPAERTDKLVRVDDSAALSAFETLETIWQSNRKRQSERLIASVERGQELIAIGFLSMALLVVASLALAFAFWSMMRQMQTSNGAIVRRVAHAPSAGTTRTAACAGGRAKPGDDHDYRHRGPCRIREPSL